MQYFSTTFKREHKIEFLWNTPKKRWFFQNFYFVINKLKKNEKSDFPKSTGNCLGQLLTTFWAHRLHVHNIPRLTNIAIYEIRQYRSFATPKTCAPTSEGQKNKSPPYRPLKIFSNLLWAYMLSEKYAASVHHDPWFSRPWTHVNGAYYFEKGVERY